MTNDIVDTAVTISGDEGSPDGRARLVDHLFKRG
jgi:hypothetical protein